jgi:holin-like protein
MNNHLYSFIAILLCLAIGHFIAILLPFLPASLYGMLVLCFLLTFNIINAKKLEKTIQWCIANMAICFLPTGVGIMQYFLLLKTHGVTMTLIIIVTTLFVLTLVAWLYQRLFQKNESVANK